MMKSMLVIVLRFEYNDEKHVIFINIMMKSMLVIVLKFEYNDEKHVNDSSKIRILWWKAC